MSVALIGGTGLTALAGLDVERSHAVDTPYGSPSAAIEEGRFADQTVLFLHRHGGPQRTIPPHLINYRANIWALRELGAKRVLAVNAVGAMDTTLPPGSLVVPDQLVDYSWGREHSFDDGADGQLQHIDFTEPYTAGLRELLCSAAAAAGVTCRDGGALAVTQGPRLETAAEVRRLARDGCDLVGMTGMPEAALAREIGLEYAALCVVVNAAAGLSAEPISIDGMREVLKRAGVELASVFRAAMPALAG